MALNKKTILADSRIEEQLNTITFVVFKDDYNKLKEITIDVIPEELGYSYTSNWSENSPIGRISPIYQYVNGSEKAYDFSITVHEDMLNKNKYKSIVDFVDAIKSMSYPIYKTSGGLINVMSFPRIFFTLGEIQGYCIVNTSINWRGPFRDGRYTVVQIDFNIIIDAPRTPVKSETVEMERKDDLSTVYYNDGTVSKITSEYQENLANFIEDN